MKKFVLLATLLLSTFGFAQVTSFKGSFGGARTGAVVVAPGDYQSVTGLALGDPTGNRLVFDGRNGWLLKDYTVNGSFEGIYANNGTFQWQDNGSDFCELVNGYGGFCIDGGGNGWTTNGLLGANGYFLFSDSNGDIVGLQNGQLSTPPIAINSIQTVINCSGSGSVIFSQPNQGSSYKNVLVYMAGCSGIASYTFPVSFTYAPQVLSQSLTANTTTVSTTGVTVVGTSSTGFLELNGF